MTATRARTSTVGSVYSIFICIEYSDLKERNCWDARTLLEYLSGRRMTRREFRWKNNNTRWRTCVVSVMPLLVTVTLINVNGKRVAWKIKIAFSSDGLLQTRWTSICTSFHRERTSHTAQELHRLTHDVKMSSVLYSAMYFLVYLDCGIYLSHKRIGANVSDCSTHNTQR